MEKYLKLLEQNSLFAGFKGEEILSILPCVGGKIVKYVSDAPVVLAGEPLDKIGVVLEGELSVADSDISGAAGLLTKLSKGDVFGCAFMLKDFYTGSGIYAAGRTVVLFMNYNKIITTCTAACVFHRNLINNLVKTVAQRLVRTEHKLGIMHKKSISAKLEAYFDNCAEEAGTYEFTIPFGRGELAEYIGVDRSAMYRELKKMQEQGILELSGRDVVWNKS